MPDSRFCVRATVCIARRHLGDRGSFESIGPVMHSSCATPSTICLIPSDDLQMPEMNGLDAIIAILAEFPDAKIIVLTTYKGDVQILRALKAGARGYLLKNFSSRR